jgi:predicted DNA-binding transcriptional regulator YafY
VLKAGLWYLVGRNDDQFRTYRVSRISRVVTLDERFERPTDFDLPAFWAESSAAFEREVPRVELVVRLQPDGLDRLSDALGRRAVEAAERLPGRDPAGWLRLRLRLDWPDDVPRMLFDLGPDVEIVEPREVRERVVAMARDIVERYASGAAS